MYLWYVYRLDKDVAVNVTCDDDDLCNSISGGVSGIQKLCLCLEFGAERKVCKKIHIKGE